MRKYCKNQNKHTSMILIQILKYLPDIEQRANKVLFTKIESIKLSKHYSTGSTFQLAKSKCYPWVCQRVRLFSFLEDFAYVLSE